MDSLTLDNNQLESLPEKLLEMNLRLLFSARKNKLTSVSTLFNGLTHRIQCVKVVTKLLDIYKLQLELFKKESVTILSSHL